MTSIQQAMWVLNGIGGTGFLIISSGWFVALVGSILSEGFVQQADRMLNRMGRAIFDGQVVARFGAGPREKLFGESSRGQMRLRAHRPAG